MTKERAWPARAMYILLAAALAISLMIMAAPAQKVSAAPDISEWSRVDTPTTDGWVLAPGSTIIDYALAEAGEVAYAVVHSSFNSTTCNLTQVGRYAGDHLLKSDDYGATWTDITDALLDELDLDEQDPIMLLQVATDWVDPDFVAVAVDIPASSVYVAFSTDGGGTFIDAGEVEDGVYLVVVSDLAVSPEAGGKREIAIGGGDDYGDSALFRCTVTGDSPGGWEDATDYDGWDDSQDFYSEFVTDIIFSTSWATDKTILVTTATFVGYYDGPYGWYDYYDVHLQSGSWGTTPGWNEMSTLGIEAVLIVTDQPLAEFLGSFNGRAIAGMTLPSDYNSKNTATRMLWVWVNYEYDTVNPGGPACEIFLVDNDDANPLGPLGQIRDGDVWLANISYHGTIAEGEALAGLIGDEDGVPVSACCEGVQVYHNDGIRNMFICCEPWKKACKPPTGNTAMAVSYVGEDKAYAVALMGVMDYDEGAWSVTFDDGMTWNQLSLIDTDIHYFSDVAVSPDCNKTFLVSVHKYTVEYGDCYGGCDSVWLHAVTLPEAEEYSGQWLRTWSGQLVGMDDWGYAHGILRLAPEETTGDTVFLADLGTGNVYRNDLETLACWTSLGANELDDIADLAPQDADIVFAVGYGGQVAMFDGDEWQEPVDSEVEDGWTIAVWGDSILVGGQAGDVSYSDDGGETFTALDDVVTSDPAYVTVAFDTYFDTNMTVYAAVAWAETNRDNGIYRYVIDESTSWTDLKAEPLESQIGLPLNTAGGNTTDDTVEVNYTGIVLDRPGNPFTDADNGGVIYASYEYWDGYTWVTGAARSLERMVSVCTSCLTWDFLHEGLTVDEEDFETVPDALKICGCLTPDTNTHLFALDWDDYDFCDNDYGSLWTYEDCYAKKAPEISSPADGAVIPADPCSCYSAPFTILWDTICDACSFDIAFAIDEDFTMPVAVNGESGLVYHIVSDTPSFSVLGGEAGGLSCETTYYIRIRAADAVTGEIIHSWWSDPIAITIAPSVEAGIVDLVAPAPGALNVPVSGVGFSWDLLATSDSFDWVLSENADLSSPLDSKTGLTSKATSYVGTLDYSTTYYWQVTAYNEGSMIGMSSVGTFTTVAETAEPPPVEEPGTPMWVWVVIAIGAVLVIVVIVLIFRTRRV